MGVGLVVLLFFLIRETFDIPLPNNQPVWTDALKDYNGS